MADSGDEGPTYKVPLNGPADPTEPLKGIVICCTSVPEEKRTQISEWAKQMGARHSYDLTPEVTHLIIGATDSQKYQFVAKQRNDVQPMNIEWIEAIRELWMNDQEIDLGLLEKIHMRPVFLGLKFSMTGCEDPAERLEVSELVKAKGGKYAGDLTKSITHLISYRTEGQKYKAAKLWGLKIVSVEWLRHSTERGMLLDEKLYDPALPEDERGRGAWDRTKPQRTSLGKRSREGSTTSLEGGKRKLRRTASTKLNSQHESIWGDIVGGGSVAQVNRSGVWETEQTEPSQQIQSKGEKQPGAPDTSDATLCPLPQAPPRPKDIFSGCRFYLHGFPPSKTEVLHTHLAAHDAVVSPTVDELMISPDPAARLFRVVPQDLSVTDFPELPNSQIPIETVTFWWVERCLHHKKYMDPSAHIIGRPFPKFPMPDMHIIISSSAFSGIDLLHLTRAVELIGGQYSEDFTPKTSVLVTKSLEDIRKDKLVHAQEWNIPILTVDWLWDSISAGTQVPKSKYKLRSNGQFYKRSESLPGGKPRHESKAAARPERTKSDVPKPSLSAHAKPKSSNPSGMDNAFYDFPTPDPVQADVTTQLEPVKPEPSTQSQAPTLSIPIEPYNPPIGIETNQDTSFKTEPLSERSQNMNSPSRTVSTAPAPSDHPFSRPRESEENSGITDAVSDLLAKKKSAPDPVEPKPKARRILGRNLSNVSTATSVDSTASHGQPVIYPKVDRTADERIAELMNGDRNGVTPNRDDTQPSSTQLEYVDTDSAIAREQLIAKAEGRQMDVEKRRREMERSVTMTDFHQPKPATRRKGRPSAR